MIDQGMMPWEIGMIFIVRGGGRKMGMHCILMEFYWNGLFCIFFVVILSTVYSYAGFPSNTVTSFKWFYSFSFLFLSELLSYLMVLYSQG